MNLVPNQDFQSMFLAETIDKNFFVLRGSLNQI